MTLWEEVESEFECAHLDTEIRYKTDSLGRTQYYEQCIHCGAQASSAIKHDSIADKEHVQPFDQNLADQREAIKRARWQDLCTEQEINHRTRTTDWWQRYKTHLKTPEWQEKREQVLERDGYLCQACLKRRATQAHHLTYDHVGNEPLFDLVAICKVCHAELHKEDGNGRQNAKVSPVLSRRRTQRNSGGLQRQDASPAPVGRVSESAKHKGRNS